MLEAAPSRTIFSVKTELIFERNTFCKSELSRWTKAQVFQNTSSAKVKKFIYLLKETHVC
jgi:hypothetical protein